MLVLSALFMAALVQRPKPITPSVTAGNRLYTVAMLRLKELGRSDVRFDKMYSGPGIVLTGGRDNLLSVGRDGALLAFSTTAHPSTIRPARALARGRKLILREHPQLPEGAFHVGSSWDGGTIRVFYQERAFGHEYLGGAVASVEFSGSGQVSAFNLGDRNPRPATLPTRILTRAELEAAAIALGKLHQATDTTEVSHYVKAEVGPIGWLINPSDGKPLLGAQIRVFLMSHRLRSNGGGPTVPLNADSGGGKEYRFSAENGHCLDPFP